MDSDTAQRLRTLGEKVDRLERQVAFLLGHLRLDYRDPPAAPPDDVREALLAGNKIEAIRLYRLRHGVDLAAAKKAVDAMDERR